MNKQYTTLPRRIGSAGFTLVEMIAVIVLIGIVAGIVVHQIGNRLNSGKYKAGQAKLQSLSMKIENYALDNSDPPQNLQALVSDPGGDAMWNGPYAKKSDIKDPFGHAFGYKTPGDHGDTFDLIFYGKDGHPGGAGLDKDVGNWQ